MSSESNSKVKFFTDGVMPSLKNRTKLKLFITSIFKNENKPLENLNYVFTTDKKILEINKLYLNHNFFTDIITFELSLYGKPIVADVFISIDRVRYNAKVFNVGINKELHRVIFHGALHLCGYSDKTRANQFIMRRREDFYLKKYFG